LPSANRIAAARYLASSGVARTDQTWAKRRTGPGSAQLSALATYRLRSRER